MRFTLSPKATAIWSRCLFYLSRVGKDVVFHINEKSMRLSTTNVSSSAYLLISFSPRFFSEYQYSVAENSETLSQPQGALPVHLLLRSLKNIRHFHLDRTVITVDVALQSLCVAFYADDNVVRTHTFKFHICSSKRPSSVQWESRHFFIASPSALAAVLHQFRTATPLSRGTSSGLPSSSSTTARTTEPVLYSTTVAENVIFRYDVESRGLLVQTYQPNNATPSLLNRELSNVQVLDQDIEQLRTGDACSKEPNEGSRSTFSFARQPTQHGSHVFSSNLPSSSMFTKTVLPQSFFDTLYIDPELQTYATQESVTVDIGPLLPVCGFCEETSAQLCVTWRRSGKPLIATFGDHFALGHTSRLFPHMSVASTASFDPLLGLAELEKDQNKLSLYSWTGILWLSTTGNEIQDDEAVRDTNGTSNEEHSHLNSTAVSSSSSSQAPIVGGISSANKCAFEPLLARRIPLIAKSQAMHSPSRERASTLSVPSTEKPCHHENDTTVNRSVLRFPTRRKDAFFRLSRCIPIAENAMEHLPDPLTPRLSSDSSTLSLSRGKPEETSAAHPNKTSQCTSQSTCNMLHDFVAGSKTTPNAQQRGSTLISNSIEQFLHPDTPELRPQSPAVMDDGEAFDDLLQLDDLHQQHVSNDSHNDCLSIGREPSRPDSVMGYDVVTAPLVASSSLFQKATSSTPSTSDPKCLQSPFVTPRPTLPYNRRPSGTTSNRYDDNMCSPFRWNRSSFDEFGDCMTNVPTTDCTSSSPRRTAHINSASSVVPCTNPQQDRKRPRTNIREGSQLCGNNTEEQPCLETSSPDNAVLSEYHDTNGHSDPAPNKSSHDWLDGTDLW